MVKDCEWYYNGFCLQNIADGRVWDCTANLKQRKQIIKEYKNNSLLLDLHCPYPKLGKDK
jgi:hypothetical protein